MANKQRKRIGGSKVDTYTTQRGYPIKIKPVSPYLIRDIDRLVPLPTPPTYKTTLVSGDVQEFPHDETTLQTDEDRAAWAQYQAAMKITSAKQMSKLTEIILQEGVELPDPPAEWLEKMSRYGYTPPSDPFELKKFYLERELLGGVTESFDLVLAVMELSNDIPEEAIQAIEDAFKSGMEEYKARITSATIRKLES